MTTFWFVDLNGKRWAAATFPGPTGFPWIASLRGEDGTAVAKPSIWLGALSIDEYRRFMNVLVSAQREAADRETAAMCGVP